MFGSWLGHTTGWSLFIDGELKEWGQADTVINRVGNNEGDIDWMAVADIIRETEPTHMICEDYRVYGHKLDRHQNSKVLTIRIIGVFDFVCWTTNIPRYYQMANVAKGFCTDDKLKQWGFYQSNMRHSRDSIRHGCYFLLFNKEIK